MQRSKNAFFACLAFVLLIRFLLRKEAMGYAPLPASGLRSKKQSNSLLFFFCFASP
jgi:hypothetical protein